MGGILTRWRQDPFSQQLLHGRLVAGRVVAAFPLGCVNAVSGIMLIFKFAHDKLPVCPRRSLQFSRMRWDKLHSVRVLKNGWMNDKSFRHIKSKHGYSYNVQKEIIFGMNVRKLLLAVTSQKDAPLMLLEVLTTKDFFLYFCAFL